MFFFEGDSDVEHLDISIRERKILYQGYISVEEAVIDFIDKKGQRVQSSRRTAVLRGDAVAVLLYHKDLKALIMVEQYRYPVHRFAKDALIEIPAGMIDPGESPYATMQREILEETGYESKKLRYIQSFFISPGISSERLHLFFASLGFEDQIHKGGGLDTEAEHIRVLYWSEEEAWKALVSGKIKDGKSLIAIQWFFMQKFINKSPC